MIGKSVVHKCVVVDNMITPVSCRVVSMELTGGGERITHDVGAYEEIESITVMDARGDLNCRTSGKCITLSLS